MRPKQPSGSVDNFIGALDEEHEQEEKIRQHAGSFFTNAPDRETLIARAREFDDVEKHLVRREYWLATAQSLHKAKGSGLRLLTLPGRHRLEIEHYRKHGLLETSKNPNTGLPELGVVGFETSPEVFGLLRTSNPRFEQLFQADLIEVLSDQKSHYKNQLASLFPFDIINLDLTGNLVSPKDGPYGPVLKAIRECIKLQASHPGPWALMLTFRIGQGDTDQRAIDELTKQFQDNIAQHVQFKDECFKRHQTTEAKDIYAKDPEEALGQFAAKWVTDQAHSNDWQVSEVRQAHYYREYIRENESRQYCMKKLVFKLQRGSTPQYEFPTKQIPLLSWHIEDLVKVAKSMSVDVSKKVQTLKMSQPTYISKLQEELESLKPSTNLEALSRPEEE